ncbi:MAG: DNA polymerase IV [Desulfobulbaceae bacterium]|nr:DNA polymerase IV [Desulfobulbaceae bacterium]
MTKLPSSIIHLDMDAFFASVEILDNPVLEGQPVIVGGGHRGVVSAASYEARRFGVHSALPVGIARNRCPNGVFLSPRIERYRQVSTQIMDLFACFTPVVETISLDEAFLDVTGTERLFGTARDLAEHIRKQVRDEVGLTVSAGVGTSKLVAKIASDMNKPDGLTVVLPGTEIEFLAPLAINKLPGVGPAVCKQLNLLGVRTIGDLARVPLAIVERKLGQAGRQLHQAAWGIDDRQVESGRGVKSMGHEETFAEDLIDLTVIRRELLSLALKVGSRLRRHGLVARTVVLKTKYYDFVQTTRSKSLAVTDDDETLYRTGCQLLVQTLAGRKPLRLLGLTATNLHEGCLARQGSLFDHCGGREEKRRQINQAVDRINAVYGRDGIRPAALLEE